MPDTVTEKAHWADRHHPTLLSEEHFISNNVQRDGNLVTKVFAGPNPRLRVATELRALRAVHPVVPVPLVKHSDESSIVSEHVRGTPASELLNAARASRMLSACGRVLAAIHSVSLASLEAGTVDGDEVLAHGDFGPHNLLFHANRLTVSAVLDWEWAHVGRRIEDLAWCEWIVRTHHPDCVDVIPHLYYGYGAAMPPWSRRHRAMLATCRARQRFAAQSRDGSAAQWHRRTAITTAWHQQDAT